VYSRRGSGAKEVPTGLSGGLLDAAQDYRLVAITHSELAACLIEGEPKASLTHGLVYSRTCSCAKELLTGYGACGVRGVTGGF